MLSADEKEHDNAEEWNKEREHENVWSNEAIIKIIWVVKKDEKIKYKNEMRRKHVNNEILKMERLILEADKMISSIGMLQ